MLKSKRTFENSGDSGDCKMACSSVRANDRPIDRVAQCSIGGRNKATAKSSFGVLKDYSQKVGLHLADQTVKQFFAPGHS